MRPIALLLAAALLLPLPAVGQTGEDVPDVLVWTGTYGFRHPSITDAQLALLELGQGGAFNVRITENPAELTAAVLRDVDVLMWVSTTGKPPLTPQQRADIIRFAGCGGGNIGFHAALDSNYGWPEHAELFGAQFDSHPQNAGAGEPLMQVEDRVHPITEGWHDVESFPFDDEYYRWRSAKGIDGVSLPRELPGVDVLLSLDETTVAEGIQEGPTPYEEDQPIAWIKTFRDAGRVYYNNMGHSSSTWSLPEFRTALVNGVDWVSEVRLDTACFDSDEPLPAPPAPPAPDLRLVDQPCALPELQERANGTWEQSGPARALTVEGDTIDLARGIPGGLGWGAQTYILDLSGTSAATADVTFTLQIPNPADDYDLSVTTAWGWYGSAQAAGAATEEVVITDVPQCAYLHVAGDNMFASGVRGPTLVASVEPGPEVMPLDGVTRITSRSTSPADLAAGWAAEATPPTCGCALLARDDDFADALASGFPQADGRPLLLTDGAALSDGVAADLARLGVTQVTILGGTAAVSEDVAEELRALGIDVARLSGPTRIETAVAVAAADLAGTGAGGEAPLLLRAFGAPGDPTAGFADALAAGREAARAGRQVLLTASDGLSGPVATHLQDTGVTEVVVVGGTAAVGEQVLADLADLDITVRRVAGDTRVTTAVAVATELAGIGRAVDAPGIVLLDGQAPTGWAEGFVAAGSTLPGPVVLANGTTLPEATLAFLGEVDGGVPLTCGALVAPAACDAAASRLGLVAAGG